MVDGLALLAGLQLADSFFPSGLFTQSHGLEQFVALGTHGPDQVGALLRAYLLQVVGPADAVALRWVMRAEGQLSEVGLIDQRLDALKMSSESREGSRRSGRAVLTVGQTAFADGRAQQYATQVNAGTYPGHHAIAVGLLLGRAGLDEATAVLCELHAVAAGWLAAAVRLGALDYVQAQTLLHATAPWLVAAAAIGQDVHWTDMGGWAPLIDIRQMQHAASESRLFAS
ncbi:MAG: urease accessory protein [Herpetosiphonaceae bacterium]|nr:urease accessory protein [Herpetosiphonaceae bacterium]